MQRKHVGTRCSQKVYSAIVNLCGVIAATTCDCLAADFFVPFDQPPPPQRESQWSVDTTVPLLLSSSIGEMGRYML